jgi:hypothetical protein
MRTGRAGRSVIRGVRDVFGQIVAENPEGITRTELVVCDVR